MAHLPLYYKYLVSIYIRLGLVDNEKPRWMSGLFAFKNSYQSSPAFQPGCFGCLPGGIHPGSQKIWGLY